MSAHPYYLIGRHYHQKYRAMARRIGIGATRMRMRKDGVPPELRELILSPDGYEPPPKPGWFERLAARIFSLTKPLDNLKEPNP